jgi:hypothetical protein
VPIPTPTPRLRVRIPALLTVAASLALGGCTDDGGQASVSDTISDTTSDAAPGSTADATPDAAPDDAPDASPPVDCTTLGRSPGDNDASCGGCVGDVSAAFVPVACAGPVGEFDCALMAPESGDLGFWCERQPGLCTFAGAACEQGCLEPLWLRFDLGTAETVGRMLFRSDWWNKRPDAFEVWVSDSAELPPGRGATLVYSGRAQTAPWQCVNGDPCTPDDPAECCPGGVGSTQVVAEGMLVSRNDVAQFFNNNVAGRFVWFQVNTFQMPPQVYIIDLMFERSSCLPPAGPVCDGACAPGVECTEVAGAPVCGPCPGGTTGDGVVCTEVDGCAVSPCFPGVDCTDVPAPGEGAVCGRCPAGTSGDGFNCAPDVCEPGCADWQVCSGGTCFARNCADDSGCPGAACFLGQCTTDSCQDRCTRSFGGGHTWECVSSTCRILDCLDSGSCGGGQVCLSNPENERGTFDQYCISAGSTPCPGGCAGFQLCSASSERCIP